MTQWFASLGAWGLPAVVLAAAAVWGVLLHWGAFFVLRRIAARTENEVDDLLVARYRKPAMLILPLLMISAALPGLDISSDASAVLGRIVTVGLIAGLGWLVIAGLNVGAGLITARYDLTQADNLAARRIHTQVNVIRRVCIVVVVFLAGAGMLMTFPSLRNVGISLFASAGVAGLVVGLAARPTLSNLIAGLQIALTDPIRLDDVVIVEGEWGRVEEITTTYVVVRVWDMRRLIVPLTHFIEKPFQNWTRQTAEILGTVYLHADYTVPVEEVRQELHRVLASTALWDGKVWGLVVTNATDRTVELRALMSAPDSSSAWDLRCLVRERLIAFLQERYPGSLPRTRADVSGGNGPGDPRAAAA